MFSIKGGKEGRKEEGEGNYDDLLWRRGGGVSKCGNINVKVITCTTDGP